MNLVRSEQIRELYEAALARPSSERASFIAERTAGDADLRESVERLLSQRDATAVGRAEPAAPIVALAPGTRIATYRIDSLIAEGGMGTVYRATDTKLQRPVAIKFLSDTLADAQARRRFRQEAETASSLNHPHIVTVYDVGEHDGRQYIVSELVDGGTLSDWSATSRQRAWRQSVELLTGVADAIASAHAAGVLHRDLKPGNILIGSNGYAKLADFGLAKLLEPARRGIGLAKTTQSTGAGVVIGTVAYMSPEQAEGQPLDARSDIFSFGVVLYELLAGRRPFEGATDLETLKTIVHGPPPPLPDDIPEALRTVVDKALEKDPAERYQHMQDMVVDLRRTARKASSLSQSAVAVGALQHRRRFGWQVIGGLVAAAIALTVTAALYFRDTAVVAPEMSFEISAPGYVGNLAIAPNGEQIAYIAAVEGKTEIWLRPIGAPKTQALTGTEGASSLFWSPDSRSLAFFADGRLKRIDVDGGPPQDLARASLLLTPGSWSRGGTILYTATPPTGVGVSSIARLLATGGPAVPVTTVDTSRGEVGDLSPWFLPDGDHFIYGILSSGGVREIMLELTSLTGMQPRPLLRIGTVQDPRERPYSYADGQLLIRRDNVLVAQRFDTATFTLQGEPARIAANVGDFSASETGVLVYHAPATTQAANRQLKWIDRKGGSTKGVDAPRGTMNPRLSPDGARVAVNTALETLAADIWTIDLEGGAPTRLTFEPGGNFVPIWSPDGTRIAFNSARGQNPPVPNQLFQKAADCIFGESAVYWPADLLPAFSTRSS